MKSRQIVADGKEPGSVRGPSSRKPGIEDLRRSLERLEGLPMRPTSARAVLATMLDDDDQDPQVTPPSQNAPLPLLTELDPGWALARSRAGPQAVEPLATLAGLSWWLGEAASDSLTRLWRHSLAVAFAAQRLAREGNDPDPSAVGRAGLLHGLGLWAMAAVEPAKLVAWLALPDLPSRRAFERQWLGVEASSLGRTLATRWACDLLVIDSAWLHADRSASLNACSNQPERLIYVQQAYLLAERTPWALSPSTDREFSPTDPRVRILMAEVQARSGIAFIEADASLREERLTRDNARLRQANVCLASERDSLGRFARALADSSPLDGPETWSDRASLAWCGEAGVASARVVWSGTPEIADSKPATEIIPLGATDQPLAHVHLWRSGDRRESLARTALCLDAWNAWTLAIAERFRLENAFDAVVSVHRGRVALEEPTLQRAKLEALAEFAAGAGHELNNPLAVIVGRGQLLLAREVEPDAQRSLRAIITQAQRAHRILRDLMYVARPPEARPRACQPVEIFRASLRDLQAEAETRGVRIDFEAVEPSVRIWADQDALRQVVDVLTRNALEATPSGGSIRVAVGGDARKLRWSIHDTGRGISPVEGAHLFDPFYCGRQAGRGLGLGLPRIARIIAQAGGELSWQSGVEAGSTFHVVIPVAEIPAVTQEEKPGDLKVDRALLMR